MKLRMYNVTVVRRLFSLASDAGIQFCSCWLQSVHDGIVNQMFYGLVLKHGCI